MPPEDSCPICSTATPFPMYFRYLCGGCMGKARAADGRPVSFANEGWWGGGAGFYVENGERYPGRTCFIDGIECRVDDGRFGGIVMHTSSAEQHRRWSPLPDIPERLGLRSLRDDEDGLRVALSSGDPPQRILQLTFAPF